MKDLAFFLIFLAAFTSAFSMPTGRVFVALSLVAFVADLIRRRQRPFVPAVAWLALAFFGAAVVSACVGEHPGASLGSLDKLAWFVAILLYANLVTSPARLSAVVGAFAAGTGIMALRLLAASVSVCSAAAAAGKPDMSWASFARCLGRAPGPYDFWWGLMDGRDITHPQLLMVGIVFAVGFILVCRREGRAAPGWWALLALLVPAMLLQFKKGSWACTAIVVVAFILVKARWSQRLFGPAAGWLRARRWVWLAAAGVAVALAVLPPVRTAAAGRWHAVTEKAKHAIPGTRLTMWLVITPRLAAQHPLGVGWCGVTYEMMRGEYWLVEPRKELHSNVCQILVEMGAYGLLIYLAWMVRALADAAGLARRTLVRPVVEEMTAMALLLALAGLTLAGLAECNLRKAAVTLTLSLVMGSAAAARRTLQAASSGTSSGRSPGPG